jgi:hypothetical protein
VYIGFAIIMVCMPYGTSFCLPLAFKIPVLQEPAFHPVHPFILCILIQTKRAGALAAAEVEHGGGNFTLFL